MSDTPMTDEHLAALLEACSTGDTEGDHCDADNLVISQLNALGYTKSVSAWLKVEKWYA